MTGQPIDPERLQARARQFSEMLTAAKVAALVGVGDQLGLFQALAECPASAAEFAARTGMAERWLLEWLRCMAAAGVAEYGRDGRFSLTPETAVCLSGADSLFCVAGSFASLLAQGAILDRIAGAFRTGAGPAVDVRGEAGTRGIERQFGAWHRGVLVKHALPLLDGVVAKLSAGARAADVGCGAGVALVEMAKAFPRSEFHGYDNSEHALARAEENRAAARVANLQFHNADRDRLPADRSFDLVTTFDCLHDMTHPELAAAAIRRALADDGTWFILDIDGRATFEENLAELPMAASLYASSVLGCLGSGTSEAGGAGLGTLGLPQPAMRALVASAGFTRFRRVDLRSPVNAHYEARP